MLRRVLLPRLGSSGSLRRGCGSEAAPARHEQLPRGVRLLHVDRDPGQREGWPLDGPPSLLSPRSSHPGAWAAPSHCRAPLVTRHTQGSHCTSMACPLPPSRSARSRHTAATAPGADARGKALLPDTALCTRKGGRRSPASRALCRAGAPESCSGLTLTCTPCVLTQSLWGAPYMSMKGPAPSPDPTPGTLGGLSGTLEPPGSL